MGHKLDVPKFEEIHCAHWHDTRLRDPIAVELGDDRLVMLCDQCTALLRGQVIMAVVKDVLLRAAKENLYFGKFQIAKDE